MNESQPAPRLAVVLKGYPRLSETFIAQELKALEDRGFVFDIWSLRQPYDDRTHPIHDLIRARARYLPEYLYQEPLRVLNGWRAARAMPGYAAARRVWLRDLARDRTPNRVRRWGQALVLAAEIDPAAQFHYAHFLHTPGSVARYAALIRGVEWGLRARQGHLDDPRVGKDGEARGLPLRRHLHRLRSRASEGPRVRSGEDFTRLSRARPVAVPRRPKAAPRATGARSRSSSSPSGGWWRKRAMMICSRRSAACLRR